MALKLLILDDDDDLLEIMAARMEMRGLTVVPVRTAEDALGRMARESFDAVVIDYMLPGIDGLAAAGIIHEKYPEIRIILQTAYATAEIEKAALAAGVRGVIEKPMNIDRLIQMSGQRSGPPDPAAGA